MKHTLETIEAAQKRWRTRLKRAMTMLDKLEKQRRRLDAAAIRKSIEAEVKPTIDPRFVARQEGQETVLQKVDTGIPEFLRRAAVPAPTSALDPINAVIDEGTKLLKAEIEETKRRKTKGRIEKLKAKQRGDLKKMPLSGKAALAFIHNE